MHFYAVNGGVSRSSGHDTTDVHGFSYHAQADLPIEWGKSVEYFVIHDKFFKYQFELNESWVFNN